MKEQEVTIALGDGKAAYGMLHGKFADTVLVFVHGLTGRMDSGLPYMASLFFSDNGINSLRFNLYDGRKNARDMGEAGLKVNASDIDAVVGHCLSKGAKKVHVIGHSYAGPAIFMSPKKKFISAILYDPSHPMRTPFGDDLKYIKELNAYLRRSGTDYIFSRRFIEEGRALNPDKYLKGYAVPTIIFNAGKGTLVEAGKDYEARLKGKMKFKRSVIKEADHSFTRQGPREELFRQTLKWLKTFD